MGREGLSELGRFSQIVLRLSTEFVGRTPVLLRYVLRHHSVNRFSPWKSAAQDTFNLCPFENGQAGSGAESA